MPIPEIPRQAAHPAILLPHHISIIIEGGRLEIYEKLQKNDGTLSPVRPALPHKVDIAGIRIGHANLSRLSRQRFFPRSRHISNDLVNLNFTVGQHPIVATIAPGIVLTILQAP